MVGLSGHCEGELGKGLEARNVFLGIFGEERPEGSDLFHGIGFRKPR